MDQITLKAQRSAVRISQNRLAKLSGVSRFRIVMCELGEGTLTHEELSCIEKALHAEAARIRQELMLVETRNVDTTVMRCACPCHGHGPLNSGDRPETLDAQSQGVVAKEKGETRPLW